MSRSVCGACGELDVTSGPCRCYAPAAPLEKAVEIACPETLSTKRRCGACPTCRCLAEIERLRAAIRAHKVEFERLTLRPDPCDYDLWAALAALDARAA